MELNTTERLVLINQFRILEKLDPETDTYKFARVALENGYEAEYGQYLLASISSYTLSEGRCSWVKDVLDAFNALQVAYERMEIKPEIDSASIEFGGFDGNNEVEYLSYVNFLRETGRWESVIGPRAKNSHSRTLAVYERLVTAWMQSADKYELTKADVERIVGASLAPIR